MISLVALPGGIGERGDPCKRGTLFSRSDSLEISGFDDKLDRSHRSHSRYTLNYLGGLGKIRIIIDDIIHSLSNSKILESR